MAIGAALIGAGGILGGGLLEGVFAKSSAAKAMDFSARQAQVQRDWERQMRRTAHLDEVYDLQKAGLNPILSAGGSGASWHSVGAPQGVQAQTPRFGDLGVSTALNVMATKAEIANKVKTGALIDEQKRKTGEEADMQKMRNDVYYDEGAAADWMEASQRKQYHAYLLGDDTALTDRQKAVFGARYAKEQAEARRTGAEADVSEQELKVVKQRLARLIQETEIGVTAVQKAKMLNEIYRGDWGDIAVLAEQFSHVLPDIGSLIPRRRGGLGLRGPGGPHRPDYRNEAPSEGNPYGNRRWNQDRFEY